MTDTRISVAVQACASVLSESDVVKSLRHQLNAAWSAVAEADAEVRLLQAEEFGELSTLRGQLSSVTASRDAVERELAEVTSRNAVLLERIEELEATNKLLGDAVSQWQLRYRSACQRAGASK